MEAAKADQDYDELDKLLGEIPNATKGDLYAVDLIHSDASRVYEPISGDDVKATPTNLCGQSCNQAVKCCQINPVDNNLSLPQTPFQEVSSSDCRGAPTVSSGADQNLLNLPDEQSLVLTFEDLSIKDRIPAHSIHPISKYNPTSLCHSSIFEDEFLSAHLKKPFGLESVPTSILPFSTRPIADYVPNVPSEGCSPFITVAECSTANGIVDGQKDASFFKFNLNNLTNQVAKRVLGDHEQHRQSIPVCSISTPVHQGMHSSLPPGLAAQGCEFLASSLHQFCIDSLPHVYAPYQQVQSNMLWGDMEYERNYRNHFQYLCLQQLENQCLEAHQSQRRKNPAVGPFSSNTIHTYIHMPLPHQVGQVNQYSHVNENVSNRKNSLDPLSKWYQNGVSGQGKDCLFPQAHKFPSSSDLYLPAISSRRHQVPNRSCKQIFPQKILTRSHGVNSLQTLKYGATGNNQSPGHVDNIMLSKDNAHSYLVQCVGSLNADVPGSQVSNPGNLNNKHDVKSSYLKCDSLQNVSGQIHVLAKEQNGCRFLQQIFEKGNHEDVNIIFSEIIDHVVEIMTDSFGNYLVQKLVELSCEEQVTHIIHEITKTAAELFRIACNQHGTRVVQKIIETVKSPEQSSMIVLALKPAIVSLIKNNNGSHVAQRCLEYLSPESRKFLFEDAVINCIELARDRQGCCVLQKCLSALDKEQKSQLISNLITEACNLSQDPYGNYVVQYILDQEFPWATTKILDQLEGHFAMLSMQKYSSNVVEKCLKLAADDRRVGIIRELINDPHFVQIMLDQFGNYVIQSARRECKGATFLEAAIKPHIPALRINPYGKKVLSACFGK